MPFDGWPEVAEALTLAGRAWPEAAAVCDLRWHAANNARLRGRPYWRARWHWHDWQVRSLLRDEDRWRDPHSSRTHQNPPASIQPPKGTTPTLTVVPPESTRIHQNPSTRAEIYRQTGQTSEAEPSVRVVGAVAPPPFDVTHPDVGRLLAQQRNVTEDDPDGLVFQPARRDVDALVSSLTAGRSVGWHERLLGLALDRNWRRCTWATLLKSEHLADLRARVPDDPNPRELAPAEPWVLPRNRPARRPQ